MSVRLEKITFAEMSEQANGPSGVKWIQEPKDTNVNATLKHESEVYIVLYSSCPAL